MFLVTTVNKADFDNIVKRFVVKERQRAYYLADVYKMRFQDVAAAKWDKFDFTVSEIEVLE